MMESHTADSYFKKFEDTGARNENIPIGEYDVTVEYDESATPKYKVIKIMKGPDNIEVKQFSHIDFKGIDILIMSLYSKYKSADERRQYTKQRSKDLYIIVSGYYQALTSIFKIIASYSGYLDPMFLFQVAQKINSKFFALYKKEFTELYTDLMNRFDTTYLNGTEYRVQFEDIVKDLMSSMIKGAFLDRVTICIQDAATVQELHSTRKADILHIFEDIHSILPFAEKYVKCYENMKART